MRRKVKLLLSLLLIVTATALAADPITGSIRIRAEDWRWFETGGAGAGEEYTFLGAQLRASAKKQLGPVEGTIELAAPLLWNLPEDAVLAPPRGQLGLGAAYYQANGDSSAAGLFVKQAFLKTGGFRIGRFEFGDGMEQAPSSPALAALRRDRIAHRLIGTFAFSHVGRSFDGLQYDGKGWTLLAARPTAGVFDVHGGNNLDVGLAYASWVHSTPASDLRLFWAGYRDDRDLVKTDNRPAPIRTADRDEIEIQTLGGHFLATHGNADLVLWGAWQSGDWGQLSHSAYALDIEGGLKLGKGNVRGGWYYSSGDGAPGDGDHETFFQILPTPRIYARFPFYNGMNSNDLFVQVAVTPSPKWILRSEVHRLALASNDDLWYAGGGAYDDESFGYAGRPSSGHGDLATVIDLSADWKLDPKTTVGFYLARAFGGNVVDSIFEGDDATYAFIEVLRRF